MGRNHRKWTDFAHPVESLGKERREVLGPMGTLEVSNFVSGSGRDLGYPEGPADPVSDWHVAAGEGWEGNSLSCFRFHSLMLSLHIWVRRTSFLLVWPCFLGL